MWAEAPGTSRRILCGHPWKAGNSCTQLDIRRARPRTPGSPETRPGLLVCWWERTAWDSNPLGTSLAASAGVVYDGPGSGRVVK
jgi:hypothetical protein